MRIEKCYFCSVSVYPGHGTTFVRNDCKEFRFCRSKCLRAFKRRKNPRMTRWTKAYRKSHGKELAIDPIYNFECIRNEPTKYDEKMWNETIKSIGVIQKVKARREKQFINQRFIDLKEKQMNAIDKDLRENKHLLERRNRAAAVSLKEKILAKIKTRKHLKKVGKLSQTKVKNILINEND